MAPRHYGDLQKRCNADLTGDDLLNERCAQAREVSNKGIPNSKFTMLDVPQTIEQGPCDKAHEKYLPARFAPVPSAHSANGWGVIAVRPPAPKV